MKRFLNVVTVIGTVALLGCRESERNGDSSLPPTNVSAQEIKREVREAVEATKAYAAGSKDQFVASMKLKLQEWDRKIDELGKSIETLEAGAKAEGSKALDGLREQRAQLGQKLEELKTSGQEFGQDVKAGLETAAAELEKAYENNNSKFKQ
jgi:uncharacterized protein YdcH (DUF465 family)